MSDALPIVYCEHGALSAELRAMDRNGRVRLVHFPHDPTSRARVLDLVAPAQPRWADMHVSWTELQQLNTTWADLADAGRIDEILAVIGSAHRRDAQHLEAARRAGAIAFVTTDTDILSHAEQLRLIVGCPILTSDQAAATLERLLSNGAT